MELKANDDLVFPVSTAAPAVGLDTSDIVKLGDGVDQVGARGGDEVAELLGNVVLSDDAADEPGFVTLGPDGDGILVVFVVILEDVVEDLAGDERAGVSIRAVLVESTDMDDR